MDGYGTFTVGGYRAEADMRQGTYHGTVFQTDPSGTQSAREYVDGVAHGRYVITTPKSLNSGTNRKIVQGENRNGYHFGRWNAVNWDGTRSSGTYDEYGRPVTDSEQGVKIADDFGEALFSGFATFVDLAFDVGLALLQGAAAAQQSPQHQAFVERYEAQRVKDRQAAEKMRETIRNTGCDGWGLPDCENGAGE